MKKQLLTICASLVLGSISAQTPSSDWTNQQAVFPSGTITTAGIKFIDAVDANVVWAVGFDPAQWSRNYNWYSRTIDGGQTFTFGNIYPDTGTFHIANLEAIDANTAWVSAYKKGSANTASPGNAGSGGIHRTTNGGQTWVNMTASGMYTNSASFCNIVSFFTPSIGITQGDPVNGEFEIWRTIDGGSSWSPIPGTALPDPLANEFAIVDLYYKLGNSYLWFGTNEGRIYRTTDAGLTWNATMIAPSTTLTEIAFSSPLNGVVYLWNGASSLVYNTYDGGVTWTQINPTGNIGMWDIRGIPNTGLLASFGAAVNNEFLSYSADNGLTWIDWMSTDIPYLVGDFVDGTVGWAGSWNFQGPQMAVSNLWKYTGQPLSGTTTPVSAFVIPTQVCLSGPGASVVPVNNSTGAAPLTYSWSASSGAFVSSSSAASPTIGFVSAGTYTINLLTTDANSGTNVSSQIVTVYACSVATPDFNFDENNACVNLFTSFVNLSTGGSPAPSYSWSASTPNATFSPSSVGTDVDIRFNQAGTYSVTLYANSIAGTSSITKTVNVISCAPNASFVIVGGDVLFNCERTAIGAPTMTTSNQTPTTSVGVNSYSWSISPMTNVIYGTSQTVVNMRARLTNTNITTYTVTLRAANASGTTTFSRVVTMSFDCSDISEAGGLANLLVYPNPSHGTFKVRLPEDRTNFRVILTNVLGSVISDEKGIKGEYTLDVSNNPSGVYFVTVEDGESRVTKKVIIE